MIRIQNEAVLFCRFHFPPLVLTRSGSKGLNIIYLSQIGSPSRKTYIEFEFNIIREQLIVKFIISMIYLSTILL